MRICDLYRLFALSLICVLLIGAGRLHQTRAAATDANVSGVDIILDPGHGGVDGGAVGCSGTLEKDLNLLYAIELKALLEAEGLNVLMTRTEDISIHDASATTIRQKKVSDLKNRLSLINAHPEALFISIHQNSLGDKSVHGSMFYCGTLNAQSQVLAECLYKAVIASQPDNRKTVKQAQKNLYLLSNAVSPAVLVECGFLSNPAEEATLCSREYRLKLCKLLRDGIMDYLTRGFVS